jgi:hypothetical protein
MLSSKILFLCLFVLSFHVALIYTMIYNIIVFFFRILVYVTSTAAGYNMLQLCKHTFSALPTISNFKASYYMYIAWITFLLDQVIKLLFSYFANFIFNYILTNKKIN